MVPSAGPMGARTIPVAIVQPLPERLKRRTALPGSVGLLTARGPAAAKSALRFTPHNTPEVEVTGPPFTHSAQLVPKHPGARVPGLAAPLQHAVGTPQSYLSDELALTFRAYASTTSASSRRAPGHGRTEAPCRGVDRRLRRIGEPPAWRAPGGGDRGDGTEAGGGSSRRPDQTDLVADGMSTPVDKRY